MKHHYIVLTLLAIATFLGCSPEAGEQVQGESVSSFADFDTNTGGRITVRITDAPFPHDLVAETNVTIFKIEARLKEGGKPSEYDDDWEEEENEWEDQDDENDHDNDEGREDDDDDEDDDEDDEDDEDDDNDDDEDDDNDDDDDKGAREQGKKSGNRTIVLMEEERSMNLLELTNGLTLLLADAEVPSGTYDQLRIYLRGAHVVLTNSTVFDLDDSKSEEKGIKIKLKPKIQVKEGISTDVLLDFDVSKSFKVKGKTNSVHSIEGFDFKPKIKATNTSNSGTLSGIIFTKTGNQTLGLKGAQVSVYAADTLNTTSFTDETGGYTIMGLTAGSYDVLVTLNGYKDDNQPKVNVKVGYRTLLDFELMAQDQPAQGSPVIRINCGGPDLMVGNIAWVEDDFYLNGSKSFNAIAIANTDNAILYQSDRYTSNGVLDYSIPVENGSYVVRLHFAEIFYGVPGPGSMGGPGYRIFNISIENGQKTLDNYDIITAAGGSARAIVETFSGITVSDGTLDFNFTSVVENAKISGIEVLKTN